MLLETLEADGFRNLRGKIDLSPGLNIFTGANGQGKTNWLEAIHILATTRSFKTAKLQEAIAFDRDEAYVTGNVRASADLMRRLQAALRGNTKSFYINGKRESIPRYLGQLHSVMFNADEIDVVRGTPDPRRKFLDAAITAIHPPYVQVLADYNRVIKQKNALFQNARESEMALDEVAAHLEPWNEQLAVLAARIHRSRVRIVERLNEALEERLFGGEVVTIRYASSLEEHGDLTQYDRLISERLQLRVQAELAAGYSLIGPHRDELEILFDGRDLRKFGSAGQQRSAFLLLQLANISVFHAQRGEYPLFLLDDIDAELDYDRIGHLLEFLKGKTQCVVTTSKESFVEKFGSDTAIFDVAAGTVSAR
jgi:DNA replication and repair protein RecF